MLPPEPLFPYLSNGMAIRSDLDGCPGQEMPGLAVDLIALVKCAAPRRLGPPWRNQNCGPESETGAPVALCGVLPLVPRDLEEEALGLGLLRGGPVAHSLGKVLKQRLFSSSWLLGAGQPLLGLL